jgi:hypothetical protein
MRMLRGVSGLVLGCALGGAVSAHAGCKLVKNEHYECDRELFAKKLAEASVVRVDAGRMELFATDRTEKLVRELGKQVAAEDQRADMVFEVAAVDRTGQIDFGPHDIPLARLNVYDAEHHLVWVETLDGQGEIPWSADVIELLKRFQASVAGSKG